MKKRQMIANTIKKLLKKKTAEEGGPSQREGKRLNVF